MPVTPTGAPAWTRTNNFASYGGDLDKKNFASRGVVNPKTDVGAEAFARITADLAALARTAPFGVFTIQCNDSEPPLAPTVVYASMMTGTRKTSYAGDAPPAGFPSVVRDGNGKFTMTFAASYLDPYGVSGPFVASQAKAQRTSIGGLGLASPGGANAAVLSPTTVQVFAFDATGTASPSAQVSVTVGGGG